MPERLSLPWKGVEGNETICPIFSADLSLPVFEYLLKTSLDDSEGPLQIQFLRLDRFKDLLMGKRQESQLNS